MSLAREIPAAWFQGVKGPVKKALVIVCAGVAIAIGVILIGHRTGPAYALYKGKTIAAWSVQLDGSDQKRRDEAASIFRALGSNSVPGLVQLLKAKDSFLRAAIWSIPPSVPKTARQFIQSRVGPPVAKLTIIRSVRAVAVVGPDARDAVPALMQKVHDKDPFVRWESAVALGRIGGPAIPELISALNDKDAAVRRCAACALGENGPADNDVVAAALLRAMDDPSVDVRIAVSQSLGQRGPKTTSYLVNLIRKGDARNRQRGAQVLSLFRPVRELTVPPLVDMLRDEDPACRLQAVRTLATFQLPPPPVVDGLCAVLNDTSLEVRLGAINALGQAHYTGSRGIPGLTVCLRDDSVQIRKAAANALGAFGPRANTALHDLEHLSEDADPSVRLAAQNAIARITALQTVNAEH